MEEQGEHALQCFSPLLKRCRICLSIKISSNLIFSSETCYSDHSNHFKAFPILGELNFQCLGFYLSAIIGRKLCMLCAVLFFFSSKRKKGQQLQFPLSRPSSIQDSCSARQQNELSNISLRSVKSAILQQIVSVSLAQSLLCLHVQALLQYSVVRIYFYKLGPNIQYDYCNNQTGLNFKTLTAVNMQCIQTTDISSANGLLTIKMDLKCSHNTISLLEVPGDTQEGNFLILPV